MAYRVLIVDDSPAMRAFVRRVIEISGFELSVGFEAGDGNEALTVLQREWVDLILTDINMPGMDGEQFLRRLEADQMLRALPVVVISTDATAGRIQRMISLGARGYVTKPFTRRRCALNSSALWGCPVPRPEIREALAGAVERVLEEMFFISPAGATPPAGRTGEEVVAGLDFEGNPCGSLLLRVTPPAARAIAANFLAADEPSLTGREVDDVICELTNMICGAALSRLESETAFHLHAPRIISESAPPDLPDPAGLSVDIGIGVITAALQLRSKSCLSNEKSAS